MFKRGCLALLVFVASACGGSSSTTSPAPLTAARFSLTGQVAESTSTTIRAISGATIRIGDGPNAGKVATTDGSGNYSFAGLQPSGFTVNVSANNYASQSKSVTLDSNQVLSFRLNRTTSTVQPSAFELNGAATDDDNQPVVNAILSLDFLTSDVPGTYFAHVSGVTDGAGFYRIAFSAVPGAMHGPAGTNDAIAFGGLSRAGYDSDSRYILGTSHAVSQNFRLHRIKRMTAGESTGITVAPDDAICDNNTQDSHPWPQEFVCRSVRVVAPSDGIMTLEAIPTQGGPRAGLEVETVGGASQRFGNPNLGNPTSIQVTAGTEVLANVEIPWGSAASQSFTLNTSMARQ